MTLGWVLDCSLALALGLPDEKDNQVRRFSDELHYDTNIWVPPLWWYEISNGLAVSVKRGRINQAEAVRLMGLYRNLPLKTDIHVGESTFISYSNLAVEYRLSAYDASYLEIAMRRGIGLATLDKQLSDIAQACGVSVWAA